MAPAMYYLISLLILVGIVYTLDAIFVKGLVRSRWPRVAKSKLRLIVYILLLFPYILFLMPLIPHLFASENERPSPVDASLITLLTPAQVEEERIITTLDSLQDHNLILNFEVDLSPQQSNWSRSYRFSYRYDFRTVRVSVNMFWNEGHLISILPRFINQYERQNSMLINNENNNTQAFLHASHVPISRGVPMSYRMIRTELRLGNTHIMMSEERDRNNYYPNASTAFIQLLYELLTAEE